MATPGTLKLCLHPQWAELPALKTLNHKPVLVRQLPFWPFLQPQPQINPLYALNITQLLSLTALTKVVNHVGRIVFLLLTSHPRL